MATPGAADLEGQSAQEQQQEQSDAQDEVVEAAPDYMPLVTHAAAAGVGAAAAPVPVAEPAAAAGAAGEKAGTTTEAPAAEAAAAADHVAEQTEAAPAAAAAAASGVPAAARPAPKQAVAAPTATPPPAAEVPSDPESAREQSSPVLRNLKLLDEEVMRFAAGAAPSEDEKGRQAKALERVRRACAEVFGANPRMRVEPFGSYVHGIALKGGDLDVVVVNCTTPRSNGFTPEQKELLGVMLKSLSQKLQEQRSVRGRPFIIYNARIPIIRAVTVEGVAVDISIHTDESVRAAQWLRGKTAEFPALRPLCMALKAHLAAHGMLNAAGGALSTWALCQLALAVLLEQRKAGLPVERAGQMLLGACAYFGRVFDYEAQAVAVKQGGVVEKDKVGAVRESQRGLGQEWAAKQARWLVVEDPLTSRNITAGAHRTQQVAASLAAAASALEAKLKVELPPLGGFLASLFNVHAALEGGTPALQQKPVAVSPPAPPPQKQQQQPQKQQPQQQRQAGHKRERDEGPGSGGRGRRLPAFRR